MEYPIDRSDDERQNEGFTLEIEDIYPHIVKLKHKGDFQSVSLKCVKWLEQQGMIVNDDFYLIMRYSDERIAIRFVEKNNAKLFKENKKHIRDA